MAYNAGLITEPKSLSEALTTDYTKEWKMAVDLVYKTLMENETWELVELPCGLINPQHACAERVTVVVSCVCVCLSVCMYVCPNMLFWQYAQLEV